MPTTMTLHEAVRGRLARLRAALRPHLVETLLVTGPVDVGYLSGFTGEDAWLLAGEGRPWLITDGRFTQEAARDCPQAGRIIRKGPLADAAAKIVRRKGIKRIGFDPESVSVALRARLRKAMKGVRLVEVRDVLRDLRIRKDAVELRAIRKAVTAAEEGFLAFRKRIRPGLTERHLAAMLEFEMRAAGADGIAFPTIVAIDGNASKPHAQPGSRRLKKDSLLLVDFGARVQGYVSDLTRTLFIGRIPPRARRLYDVVLAAQDAGIRAVGPGAAFRDVDAAARRVISEAGHGPRFRHGLGHGLGRLVHEPPGMGPTAPDGSLEPGMVVTVEPGIYFDGRIGIRIEDDVLVTPAGRRVLTHLPRDPEAMVV
jgi:Xaa-Pro aminopeptidase